jgi:hypothetical protein
LAIQKFEFLLSQPHMSTLLDLVFNFIRVNQLNDSPLAVIKYANLQPPLVLQNLLLLQRHWALNLLECCDIVHAFSRSESFERSNRSVHAPLAPTQLCVSQQTFVLTQVLQLKYYVYVALAPPAPAGATTTSSNDADSPLLPCIVLARLNTVLLLIGFDNKHTTLETRLTDFISFVNTIS